MRVKQAAQGVLLGPLHVDLFKKFNYGDKDWRFKPLNTIHMLRREVKPLHIPTEAVYTLVSFVNEKSVLDVLRLPIFL